MRSALRWCPSDEAADRIRRPTARPLANPPQFTGMRGKSPLSGRNLRNVPKLRAFLLLDLGEGWGIGTCSNLRGRPPIGLMAAAPEPELRSMIGWGFMRRRVAAGRRMRPSRDVRSTLVPGSTGRTALGRTMGARSGGTVASVLRDSGAGTGSSGGKRTSRGRPAGEPVKEPAMTDRPS